MNRCEFMSNDKLPVNTKDILYYMGCGESSDANITALAEKWAKEAKPMVSCKACLDIFPVTKTENGVDFGFAKVCSNDLKSLLEDCERAVFSVATIGFEIDRAIQRYSSLSPSNAACIQAFGAAAIEAWCDELCLRFSRLGETAGKYLRPRFSPGYGDLSIEFQRDIFKALDCGRKIGVSLTDSFMMLPSKSVSAIVGIGNSPY